MMEEEAGFKDIKFMIPLKCFSEVGSVRRYLHVFAGQGKSGTRKIKLRCKNINDTKAIYLDGII